MLRVLGIPALLVAVVVGVYLSMQSMQSNGPTSASGRQAITQAQSEVAATNFGQADAAMGAFYAQSGTYAGAALPPGTGSSSSGPMRPRTACKRGTSTRTAPADSLSPAPARAAPQPSTGCERRQSGDHW